jgi:hypothetical protein
MGIAPWRLKAALSTIYDCKNVTNPSQCGRRRPDKEMETYLHHTNSYGIADGWQMGDCADQAPLSKGPEECIILCAYFEAPASSSIALRTPSAVYPGENSLGRNLKKSRPLCCRRVVVNKRIGAGIRRSSRSLKPRWRWVRYLETTCPAPEPALPLSRHINQGNKELRSDLANSDTASETSTGANSLSMCE